MYIHVENWVHGQEDYFLNKYKDDFFFRGLYDSEDIMPDRRKNISKQEIIKGIERHKQVKDTMYGKHWTGYYKTCLLYTSPSPRDVEESRMPSSA